MMADSESSTLATWRGRRILVLLCAVAFLNFVDASITNVAMPHIRTALHFSAQDLQWVPSAYLLTYGGFMLLGGRLADLIGRRTIILGGTFLVALSSLAADSPETPACSSVPASPRDSGPRSCSLPPCQP